ncbi:MAG TPA: hypothetical protein VM327_08350 [Candidatus Thermoplasmatota archaeon]|nr:hypothetical protein [Candidatus Thermoplasmatota archaeon]
MAWIDGNDPWTAKGRAKNFCALTWVFSLVFLAQVVILALPDDPLVTATDLIGPLLNLFLALASMVLAYDYRRQWLSFKATAPGA